MRFKTIERPVAATVLITFLSLVLQPLAVLAQERPLFAGRSAPYGTTGEAKFSRILNEIHELLKEVAPQAAMPHTFAGQANAKQLRAIGPNVRIEVEAPKPLAGVNVGERVSRLRAKAKELHTLEEEVRKGFVATEKHIREKNLPAVILARHEDALRAYEARSAEFKVLLNNVERVADAGGAPLQSALTNLGAYMAKYPNQRTHTTIDPNNLPWGSPRPVERAPYTTPDQFKTSGLFKQQEQRQLARRMTETKVKLAQSGSLSGIGLPSTQLPPTPEAADLAETEDVQLSIAVRAKAAELGNQPVAIFNWVRNNIEFVPSYGSVQGSDVTLQTKRANAFDTASLLIALLRAANIPARYVYGTIEVPAEKVMNWVGGVTVPDAAQQLMGQGGIPNIGVATAGRVTAIRLEHVWVEAYVDYVPSRGAVHRLGDTWVPMDGSYKNYHMTPGMDVRNNVPFDGQSFIEQLRASASINELEGSLRNVDGALLQQALSSREVAIKSYVSSNKPNATVGDVLGIRAIIPDESKILLGTLPYRTVAIGSRFQAVPDNLRWKFRYAVYASEMDRATDNAFINVIRSTASLAGKKFVLSFTPASQADASAIASYQPQPHQDGSPIHPDEYPSSLPGYLIRLIPQLRLDEEAVALGAELTMGTELFQQGALYDPSRGWQVAQANSSIVGERRLTSLDLQGTAPARLDVALNAVSSAASRLETDTGAKQLVADNALYLPLIAYFAYVNATTAMSSLAVGVIDYRSVSFGNLTAVVEPILYFGVPRETKFAGINIDIDRLAAINVSRNNSSEDRVAFNIQTGQQLSSMEHLILERSFTDGSQSDKAISTVQALQIASKSGQKILTIESRNKDVALPMVASAAVAAEIGSAVDAGRLVVVHTDLVQTGTWQGFGYAIIDTETGAGAFQISGGTSGGFLNFLNAVLAQPQLLLPVCADTYFQTLANNFLTTNAIIPGISTPLFSTIFTAGATAQAIGGITALQALTVIFSVGIAPVLWPALIVAVLITAIINWIIFTLVFEIGILIGSAVGAAYCRRP